MDRTALAQLTTFVGTYGLRGLIGLARTYLGPEVARVKVVADDNKTVLASDGKTLLAADGRSVAGANTIAGLSPLEQRILALAVAKLAYEAGELSLHNPNVAGDSAMPSWTLDDHGLPPALSLAHLLAVPRLLGSTATTTSSYAITTSAPRTTARAVQLAARTRYYAGSSPRAPEVSSMSAARASSSRPRTGGCGCGGGAAPTPPTVIVDPCAGGVPSAPPPIEPPCSCGGTCGGRGCSCAPPTRTYDSSQCPTFAISCETKERLRECVKVALCDFARCASDAMCRDRSGITNEEQAPPSMSCFDQLVCSFLRCLPDALCPPPCPPAPAPRDCLPCGYAVEVMR